MLLWSCLNIVLQIILIYFLYIILSHDLVITLCYSILYWYIVHVYIYYMCIYPTVTYTILCMYLLSMYTCIETIIQILHLNALICGLRIMSLGICTLLPYNCLLNAQPYFEQRLGPVADAQRGTHKARPGYDKIRILNVSVQLSADTRTVDGQMSQ